MYSNRINGEQEYNIHGLKLLVSDTDFRFGKSSSPASVSDLTDTNASLTTKLQEEKSKVQYLQAQLEQIKSNNTNGTSTHTEPIQASIKCIFQQIVKRDLFPRKKFCEPHELMYQIHSEKTTIASFVMKKLNINPERHCQFWNTYKSTVHNEIIQARSSRIGQIRRVFMDETKKRNGKLVHNYQSLLHTIMLIYICLHLTTYINYHMII